jgi:adenylosuccinate lyase
MSIRSISPLDGRYAGQVAELSGYFSEWALIKYRVLVEVRWLLHMAQSDYIPEVRSFSPEEVAFLEQIVADFDENAAERVKTIERTTNHDVKAVEYFLKEKLQDTSLASLSEFIHFACTSEDINNLAYGLMLRDAVQKVWLPKAATLVETVAGLARDNRDVPMLAHTHGQPASPTTLGKELAVFCGRWERALKQIRNLEFLGKFGGAVGNFNAHISAYPDAPWQDIAREFVESLGLDYNPLTTQIEPHDYLAECFHALIRFNNILLDFDRDLWLYISMNYFRQTPVKGEVGSSTMPHKINPINFENSEANVEISNALLAHLANKLPVSRLQRDLSDSSALRNIGVGVAHSYLAVASTLRGLKNLSVNREMLAADLDQNWEVLGEAVQTVMRRAGLANPYEKLKELTRGARVTPETMREFIGGLDLPDADKERLLTMTPASYTGLASRLVDGLERK